MRTIGLSPAAIIELKDDREVYLVTPAIAPDLVGEIAAATIYTAINRQGVVHLWPIRLPAPDGKHNALAQGGGDGGGDRHAALGAHDRQYVAGGL